MFTALITYNCSNIDASKLLIYNETSNSCSLSDSLTSPGNSTVNVTCNNIENNAGRNWTFVLGGKENSQIIINESFTITLKPLPLNTSTKIIIQVHEDLTSASISVLNCTNIAEPEYLVIRCNSSDTSNSTLSSNCTFTCSNLLPGSIYNASLVRLPIPIADKRDGNETTFPEDTLDQPYTIG